MTIIDTDSFSEKLRLKAIDVDKKKVSVTNFFNSEQEKDFTSPANCNGFGRVRHFKLGVGNNWPRNPLPIIPAQKKLGIELGSEMKAQVFQNSVCNWRCWYCFVDFKLLSGSSKYSSFMSCEELLDLYLAEQERPKIIDLTGGQPDLTPEWVPWMMQSLMDRGLSSEIYLWSDDNLSNDYFWRFLSDEQIDLVQKYQMYGRVCCFKGIDPNSFQINTQAHPNLFYRQFELFKRFKQLDIDLFGYITLTAPHTTNFDRVIPEFFDRIQNIDQAFPLRLVPLQIFKFTPMLSHNKVSQDELLGGQMKAITIWESELNNRFTTDELNQRELGMCQ